MKKFFICLLPLFLSLAFYGHVNAQNGLLRYADQKMDETNYFEAAEGYVNAYNKKASYRAAKGAAISYAMLRDYQKNYDWWKRVISFEDASEQDWLEYIGASNQAGNTEEVMLALDSLGNEEAKLLSNLHLDSLKLWYGQQGNAKMKGLDAINTSSTEFGWVSDDAGTVYFSSDRGGENDRKKRALRIDKSYKYYDKASDWTGRDFLGIYTMNADGEVSPFEVPVPDVFHVTDPYVLKDGKMIFYTVTREIKRSKNYSVQSEIYYSQIGEDGKAMDFTGLSINKPLEYGLKSPFVDEANQRVYFASNMPGGNGGYDIYYMDYSDDFEFGEPVNLGSEINSSGNERDPYIHDGAFYFASDGLIGLGGLDVFKAKMADDTFSEVMNLGLPFNSPQDDFGIHLSGDGKVLLASNRPESKGWDDLFEMEELYRKFQALVLGCNGEPITGTLEVVLMTGEDKANLDVEQDGQGKLQAELAPETDYELVIKKNGYFSLHQKGISTKGMEGDLLDQTYQLVKIPYNTTIYVDMVFYNLDESDVRNDAENVLKKVAELLKSYSFLNISVRSHTDSRASDAYNEALSEKRADAVREFLSDYGISGSRVISEWFGEQMPLNDCGDGVPCPESLHQVNRRSELMLVAFPEEGKAYDMPSELEGLDLCDISTIQVASDFPTIYFEYDKADLGREDMMDLERVSLMLKNMLDQRLRIEGHADSRGSKEYNEHLSERRALVVKEYLEKSGIASDRLVYEFFGKSQPINDCDQLPCTAEMHRLNRRTHLSLPELNKDWTKGGN